MNSSDEFTSPIATSTVWKKKKPQGWIQEPDSTFRELCEQSETRWVIITDKYYSGRQEYSQSSL